MSRKYEPKWTKDLGGGAFITSGMKMGVRTKEVLEAMRKASRESVKRVVDMIRDDARSLAPKSPEHDGSAKPMSQSIASSTRIARGGPMFNDIFTGAVFTTNGKAVMIEFGTGLYGPYHRMIKPKKAKRMHFQYNGKSIFAKEVQGRKATPFMVPALKKNQDKIVPILRGEWNKASI